MAQWNRDPHLITSAAVSLSEPKRCTHQGLSPERYPGVYGRTGQWNPCEWGWPQLNILYGKSHQEWWDRRLPLDFLNRGVTAEGGRKVNVYCAVLFILCLTGCARAAVTAAPAEGGCPSCWPQPAEIVPVPGPQQTYFCQEACYWNWFELPCFILMDVWHSLPLELLDLGGEKDKEWGLSRWPCRVHTSERCWFRNPLNAGL